MKKLWNVNNINVAVTILSHDEYGTISRYEAVRGGIYEGTNKGYLC